MSTRVPTASRNPPATLKPGRPSHVVIDIVPRYDAQGYRDDDHHDSHDHQDSQSGQDEASALGRRNADSRIDSDSFNSSRRSARSGDADREYSDEYNQFADDAENAYDDNDNDNDDDGSGVGFNAVPGRQQKGAAVTGDESDQSRGRATRPSLGPAKTAPRRRQQESSYSTSSEASSRGATSASTSFNEGMAVQSLRYNKGEGEESLDARRFSTKLKITHAAAKIPVDELAEFLSFADAVYQAYEDAGKSLKEALDQADQLDKVRWEPRWINRWNAVTTAIRERIHPGKEKGPNLVSPIVQSWVYDGWALLSLSRLTTYLVLLAQKLVDEDSALVREPACSIVRMSAAVPTALVAVPAAIHALVMFRDHLNGQARYWSSMAQAWTHVEGALDYVNSETSCKANSVHWEAFMSACRKNPYLSTDAKLEQIRARASVRRDCIVLPCNIAFSISAQLGLILGAPPAMSGGLLASSGAAYLAQGYFDRTQGLAAEMPRARAQIDKAARRLRQMRPNRRDGRYLAAAKKTFRARCRAAGYADISRPMPIFSWALHRSVSAFIP